MSIPWEKVLTHPLGISAFSLFLVFSYLGRIRRGDKRRWLSPVAFMCAAVVLIGGLGLAYLEVPKPKDYPVLGNNADQSVQQTNRVQQSTQGPGSSNIQGVHGDVMVTVDQSTGKTEPRESSTKTLK